MQCEWEGRPVLLIIWRWKLEDKLAAGNYTSESAIWSSCSKLVVFDMGERIMGSRQLESSALLALESASLSLLRLIALVPNPIAASVNMAVSKANTIIVVLISAQGSGNLTSAGFGMYQRMLDKDGLLAHRFCQWRLPKLCGIKMQVRFPSDSVPAHPIIRQRVQNNPKAEVSALDSRD